MPEAAADPEEAFVVESGDDAFVPVADENARAVSAHIDETTAPAEPDLVAIDADDAASERMAPVARVAAGDELGVEPPLAPEASADIRNDPGDMPSFVRSAERAARWRRPRVRAALALACVAAALVLAGQWMLAQRDVIAARSPGFKPVLGAACAVFGCDVQAPRALEALRVESSGVVRVDKSDLYRLSVSLRNLRPHEVALPAFELALTDTQGQLIARRVLRAGELGARVGSLAAGAELTLQCTIQVASATVAGYTIELFYP